MTKKYQKPIPDLDLLEKALQREREARQLAEQLLEDKARELFLQRIEVEKKLENEKRLRSEATLFLSIARVFQNDLDERLAFRIFLKSVCEMTGWPVGHLYILDPDNPEMLVSSRIWHGSDDEELSDLKKVSEEMKFLIGVGLPGTVFATSKYVWIDDIMESENFPRKEFLKRPLGAAFALPIRRFGQTVGVAEFFTRERLACDERLVAVVEAAAGQVNNLLEHWGVQKTLHDNYSELEKTLKSLKNTQAQLIQSEKMASLGVLAAGVAHEINNPVSFVMSNLHVLEEYGEQISRALGRYENLRKRILSGEKLGLIVEESRFIETTDDWKGLAYVLDDIPKLTQQSMEGAIRVRDIVQNLKEFSHVDEAEFKEADINAGIRTTLKIAWNELKYKCDVVEELTELPLIPCLPQELNQVFLNLVINAAQAIEGKGTIWIRSFVKNDSIVVEVEDTGHGISPDSLSKIFDPFFTTKPIGQGTGLGLSVAHEIILKHQGRIDVQSQVGKGTKFSIVLPLKMKDQVSYG